jgi:ribose 5-phosphate isomerase B
MTIAIGADHAGFDLKSEIILYLGGKGITVLNEGTDSPDRVDYPDYGHKVAVDVLSGKADLGILMCGSGNGIGMSANRHKGIRAAISWKKEIAEMARRHNNANVLVLPARYITEEEAIKCVEIFLSTEFEGGRHERRVEKIDEVSGT